MTDTKINFDSLTSDINEFEQQLSVLRTKYQIIIKDKLNDILKSYFDADPECKAIVWTQYTPYFNDGEECIFSVNEPQFYSFNYDCENDDDYNGYDGDLAIPSSYRNNGEVYDYDTKKYRSASEAETTRGKLATLLQSESVQDVLKLTFGDHAKVTVTRDGIDSEEYEHD